MEYINHKLMIERLKDKPEILAKIYTTPDDKGCLPVHYMADINKRYLMHQGVNFDKELLKQIYTTQNNEGKLAAHYPWLDTEILESMGKALNYDQKVLGQIYTTKDNNGSLPAHNKNIKNLEVMQKSLDYNPEILAKIYSTVDNYGFLPGDAGNSYQLDFLFKQWAKKSPDLSANVYATRMIQNKSNTNNLTDNLRIFAGRLAKVTEIT